MGTNWKDSLKIKGELGVIVECDCHLESVKDNSYDMIVLSGGNVNSTNLSNTPLLLEMLKK
jgi:hypothetical protein